MGSRGGGEATAAASGAPRASASQLARSEPKPTLPLQDAYTGTVRLELALSRDFGAEDLLVVQQELVEQLGTALGAPPERFVVMQNYAAGQYYIVDVLPATAAGGAADGGGGPSAEELVAKLIEMGGDAASSLFEGRVLGLLNGAKRVEGVGLAVRDEVLLDDLPITPCPFPSSLGLTLPIIPCRCCSTTCRA